MATRTEVYCAIDGERTYQDGINKYILTIGEEIALALRYTDKALDEWTKDFSPVESEALAMLRKVAAICVRCMEHHGAPVR